MTRTFQIPAPPSNDENNNEFENQNDLDITLHEPSLTADNLGHKTWAAAFLLAQRLPLLVAHVPAFIFAANTSSITARGGIIAGRKTLPSSLSSPLLSLPPLPRILELGAGTGLVGITAAARFMGAIHLTDLEAIVPNLEHNHHANAHLIKDKTTTVLTFPLDWSDLPPPYPETDESCPDGDYDVILAADTLYSSVHPPLIVAAVARFLKREAAARLVMEVPLRGAFQPEVADFRARMAILGLETVAQGEEVGFDDWEDGTLEVTCWWSVWRWIEGGFREVEAEELGLTRQMKMKNG